MGVLEEIVIGIERVGGGGEVRLSLCGSRGRFARAASYALVVVFQCRLMFCAKEARFELRSGAIYYFVECYYLAYTSIPLPTFYFTCSQSRNPSPAARAQTRIL